MTINLDAINNGFKRTFGKEFCRKTLLKAVARQLKAKEDEFYDNLISTLTTTQLMQLKDQVNDKKATIKNR